jgi:hypothetical protein
MARTPEPMSAGLRRGLILGFGALWLSGCAWLIAHFFFARVTDFGVVPGPLEALLLRVHGWLAVLSVFLLGYVTAQHITDRWSQLVKRVSGLSMVSVAALLLLSGYALYYTTDRLHDFAAVVHEVIGAGAVLFAVTHWRRYRPRSVARDRDRTTRQPAT